jgi:hypothetical protein
VTTTEPVDWLERLVTVLPPPPHPIPPRTEPWADIEARLGFRLPDDYKRIADRYGNGSFGTFLLTPTGPRGLNLWTRSAEWIDIWRTDSEADPLPRTTRADLRRRQRPVPSCRPRGRPMVVRRPRRHRPRRHHLRGQLLGVGLHAPGASRPRPVRDLRRRGTTALLHRGEPTVPVRPTRMTGGGLVAPTDADLPGRRRGSPVGPNPAAWLLAEE